MNFRTQSEANTFNTILAAYEEEFGAENLIVIIPQSWEESINMRKIRTDNSPFLGK